MSTLARRPNNKKKPNNMGDNKGEELAKVKRKPLNPNGKNNGLTIRYSKDPKRSKWAQGSPKKEVNP